MISRKDTKSLEEFRSNLKALSLILEKILNFNELLIKEKSERITDNRHVITDILKLINSLLKDNEHTNYLEMLSFRDQLTIHNETLNKLLMREFKKNKDNERLEKSINTLFSNIVEYIKKNIPNIKINEENNRLVIKVEDKSSSVSRLVNYIEKLKIDAFNTENQIKQLESSLENERKEKEELKDNKDYDNLIEEKEKSICELESFIENLKEDSEETVNKLQKLEEELEFERREKEEYKQYVEEKNKIEKAIEKLKSPAEELVESKSHYISTRTNYHFFSTVMFISAFLLVLGIIYYLYKIDNLVELLKSAKFSFYLILVFPVVFPSILGLLFIRQANMASQEIEKINRRFVLIHEVNHSLEALVELNRGREMDGKTELIIDKLINNILDFSSMKQDNKVDKSSFLELNDSFDYVINSIKSKKDTSELV